MKWSVVILLLLGIVAAGAAAVLMAATRVHREPAVAAEAVDTPIVVAARPLEAYAVVQSDDLKVRKGRISEAPKGHLSDPAFAIGKVLRMSLSEGQLITAAAFATDDSPQSVASKLLPAGKRAKTIALTDDESMRGLLYPGCAVDVLWCFNGTSCQGNPLAKVLLENVPVLAVNRQTVLSGEDAEPTTPSRVDARHSNLVTLLLDARQSEALQLALDQGSIALVMRNPTDTVSGRPPAPLGLSSLAGGYAAPAPAAADRTQGLLSALQAIGKSFNEKLSQVHPVVTAAAPASDNEWEMTIIRGEKIEKAKFLVSAEQ